MDLDTFYTAVQKGDVQTVRRGLDAGVDLRAKRWWDSSSQTSLHVASRHGRTEVATLLIEHGADLEARGWYHNTPLHEAALRGHTGTCELLIRHGADVTARDSDQETPLHKAAWWDHTGTCELLIRHGADVMARDKSDQTSLHVASQYGQTEVAALLIEHGADLEARDFYRFTPLHVAAAEGRTGTCELLIRHGADVMARTKEQSTPLHLAALRGRTGICELLIHHGADVMAKTARKQTSLHVASEHGQTEVAALLIEHGADLEARDKIQRTPLQWAAAGGHTGTCELLIRHGADVTARNKYQFTPLHRAATGGHTGTCELLIRHGADVTARNKFQDTPLHGAAEGGHTGTCELLIRHGADVTARDKDQNTPLHLAAVWGHTRTCEILIRHGADVTARNKPNRTSLHVASWHGQTEVAALLIEHGADLEARDRLDQTSLHVASRFGQTEVAALLIEHGADLEARDWDDQTSLHVASLHEQTEVAALLIEHGADLEAWNRYQRTPLHWAAYQGHTGTCELLIRHGADVTARDKDQYTPLHLAADGRTGTCELLIRHGADVMARDEAQNTPLHRAAAEGRTGTCELLIRHGADVTARDEKQQTPLHLAAEGGHTGTCELLIRHGADVTARDTAQNTPLHQAAVEGHPGTCELLIRHGADVTARDSDQETPLHLAAARGHTGTCELLIRHGADVTARDEDGRTPSDVAHGKETLRVLKNREKEVIKEKLYSELLQKSGGVKTDRCKVSLFGMGKAGKSTLAESLQRGWVSAHLQGWTYTSSAEELHDPTPGVDVGTFHIPGVGEVSLWDFAGQSEYAVTHSMFMDAENTISIVLYNIMDDTKEQDVHRWLSFIKSCNPNRQRDVILVASHADKVSPTSGQRQAAHLLQLMKAEFKDLLRISDEVFVMNCKKTRTPEMDRLKELLAKMKKAMLEHQRQMPRLCSKITQRLPSWCQTKCSPKCPVLRWPDYVDAVKEIDPHVDEDFLRKSTRFLNHLGEVIFTCSTASDPIIVLKPNWLCTDIFGPMMAPVNFPILRPERTSEDYVTREEIQRVFQDVADVDLLVTLLQEFQLCHSYDGQTFIFPGLMKQTIHAEVWKPTSEPTKAVYFGKQVQCADSTDMFSSGFFPRVQSRLMREQENRPLLWRDGAKCVDRNVEGLIKLSPDGRAVNICVRSAQGDKVQCGKMLQQLENIIADVLDECSPGTGTEEKVLSARALKEHREEFYSYGKEEISKAAAEGGTIVHPSLGFTEQVSDLQCRKDEDKSLRYPKDRSRGDPEQRRNSKERAAIDNGEQLPEGFTDVEPTRESGSEEEDSRLMPQTPQPKIKTPQESSTDVPMIRQGPREPVILLISDEYGTSKGGVSTVNCEAGQTLEGKAVVYATVLQLNVPKEDQKAADRDGVILIQPDPSGLTTAPTLDWLTHYHLHHFPNLPQDVTCIIGHADITDTAARDIKDKRYPEADLMMFTHVIPEDTEYYKGGRVAMKAREKEKDMLDKVDKAKAAFSVGRRIFDHFDNKYRGGKEPQSHHIFLPKPSELFLSAKVRPGGRQKVVLSIGRVRKVEKLKGHDLVGESMRDVVKIIKNSRWCVRGINEDDFETSQKILEDALNSPDLNPTLLPYGTQEDIRDDMMTAHLVLMPSRSEPFGLVGLEAIAAGIPVLISNQTGLADMITDLIDEGKLSAEHRNVIVETSVNDRHVAADVERWAKRIVDVLQHSDSEFEKAARFKRELVASRYWEESHNAFLQACGIQSVLGEADPRAADTPQDGARALLDTVGRKEGDALPVFQSVLREADSRRADMLMATQRPDGPQDRADQLTRHRPELVQALRHVEPLLDLLQAMEVLSTEECDVIRALTTPQDRACALLDAVGTKGGDARQVFKVVLEEVNPEAAGMLP
ncbi:PREDICTED: uncharacterized protein LOC109479344 [Branchiostoma belcheri]|uniref:Uncharacterized protein LOC109479344 n=1 Tax=Branchiostoma belcheri TaxID=7741 RepID=A0A6P4ZRY7_BRABE|nr:PREDICTED: uncharacterized protein LOC109479344 [Branchiostoma belcheri]